jgi:uncharacterized protein YbjT (DUF2867 family)
MMIPIFRPTGGQASGHPTRFHHQEYFMTILVTGSRGSVASTLIALLQEEGVEVRAASSGAEAAVRCDLKDPATFKAALEGVSALFLYAEAAHIGEFVQAAVDAEVQHVVLLSSSSVLEPGAAGDLLARQHLEVENALLASPLATTILRPGSFAGNAKAWSRPIKSGRPISLPFPDSHADPIDEADLAECALAVLTRPELSGKAYRLTGPESLTFRQQVDRVADVLGLAVDVRPVGREEWKAEMTDHVPGPYADALLDFWKRHDGKPVPVNHVVEELTGRPALSFTDWLHDHSDDFVAATSGRLGWRP